MHLDWKPIYGYFNSVQNPVCLLYTVIVYAWWFKKGVPFVRCPQNFLGQNWNIRDVFFSIWLSEKFKKGVFLDQLSENVKKVCISRKNVLDSLLIWVQHKKCPQTCKNSGFWGDQFSPISHEKGSEICQNVPNSPWNRGCFEFLDRSCVTPSNTEWAHWGAKNTSILASNQGTLWDMRKWSIGWCCNG